MISSNFGFTHGPGFENLVKRKKSANAISKNLMWRDKMLSECRLKNVLFSHKYFKMKLALW